MSSDKTEAPTGQRLEKAREEGQVGVSTELNTAIIMLASVSLLQGPGLSLVEAMRTILVHALTTLPQAELTEASLGSTYLNNLNLLIPGMAYMLLGFALIGSVVTLAQTRFLWAGKLMGFKFDRLNPLKNLKRIFSTHGLIELGRAMLKLGVVGWMAYGYLQDNMQQIMQLSLMDLMSGLKMLTQLALGLASRVGTAYLALAFLDFVYQRWNHTRGLKMSKDEVKEEFRQQEGDPMLKARIRQQGRKMARMRMMANVPKANVVITNPTHLAIAIQYDHSNMVAPKVIAKGVNLVAFRIADIAREHNIPVVQNIPVARAIYASVEIDQEIPPELYAAIAEILVYVYRLKGQQPILAH